MAYIIESKELVQIWNHRTYELNRPMELEEFYSKFTVGQQNTFVEKVINNWDKDSIRTVAIELPEGTQIEIEPSFDWKLSEYPNTDELFKKVVRKMQQGICHFSFEMVTSHGIKIAFGTISPKCMPADKSKTPIAISTHPTIPQTYWDLEMQDWRSFLPTHLITTV